MSLCPLIEHCWGCLTYTISVSLFKSINLASSLYLCKSTIFSFELLIPTQFLFMQLEWMLLKMDPQLEWLASNRIFLWLFDLHYVNFSIQKYQSCIQSITLEPTMSFVLSRNSNAILFHTTWVNALLKSIPSCCD